MTETQQPPQQWKSILVGSGLLAAGVCLGAGVVYTMAGPSAVAPSSLSNAALPDPDSGAPVCGVDGSFDWKSLSSVDSDVQPAVEKAFVLLNLRRKDCEGGGFPQLPWEAKDFEQGSNHTHYLHARHKYASTCDAEAFKLHFHFASPEGKIEGEPTKFVAEVFHDMKSDAWSLLKSDPAPCAIETGSSSYPEPLPADDKSVKAKAAFAASELGYQMKQKGCLEHEEHLEVMRIEEARAQIEAGLVYDLILFLKVAESNKDPKEVKVRVLEVCDLTLTGRCVDELSLPSVYSGDVCSPMLADVPAEVRRLSDPNRRRLGHLPVDATEYLVAQRKLLDHPVLQSDERPPLRERHITKGDVPGEFDPREDHCYRRITVYDQGACGSCYANAAAQAIGIKKCLLDEERRRRLIGKQQATGRFLEKSPQQETTEEAKSKTHEHNISASRAADNNADKNSVSSAAPMSSAEVVRKTKSDCECQKEWSYGSSKCSDYCCNPDNTVGEWCFVKDTMKDEHCGGSNWGYCKPLESPELPDACKDSVDWADPYGDSCDWYAEHDPGCKSHDDYGQLTHCKHTCATCPPGEEDDPSDEDSDPWSNALYKYMPSVQQIAPCATEGGQPRGCNGGNMHHVWNYWMRNVKDDLHVDGEQCLQYKLKCWTSGGVTNPLTGDAWWCVNYKGSELWHKPCDCIPAAEWPTTMSCPTAPPSSAACGFEVPPLAFNLKTVSHGLSIGDAVLNMQRHIHEYGPIYVSFSVTPEFQDWDWNSKPIYTGGSGALGGHAVTLVGWGADAGTDYWLMRNSWGPGWADKGYCKFKRGENLDGIEGGEVVSFMAEKDIPDLSAPWCQFLSRETKSSFSKGKLSALDMTLRFSCDEAATIDVWNKATDGTSRHRKVQASAKKPVHVEVELLCAGWGRKVASNMEVVIKTSDHDGNEATNWHVLQIQAYTDTFDADFSQCPPPPR